jgi:hypothetical protein
MLKILHKTWAGENWSVSKAMLVGMARFMRMYEFSSASFVKAFREVTYEEINAEADRFGGMSMDGAYATALAEIYDRKNPNSLKSIA